VVLIHQRYRRTDRQTDRRTDGRTDGRHAISIPRYAHSASRGNKDWSLNSVRIVQYVIRGLDYTITHANESCTGKLHRIERSSISVQVSCTVFSSIFTPFCAQQHICYSAYMLSPVCLSGRLTVWPSVCLAVTLVDQSKMVEARIMQLSLQGSPMTSFHTVNLAAKFQARERAK